jgi:hypothetical protein
MQSQTGQGSCLNMITQLQGKHFLARDRYLARVVLDMEWKHDLLTEKVSFWLKLIR